MYKFPKKVLYLCVAFATASAKTSLETRDIGSPLGI